VPEFFVVDKRDCAIQTTLTFLAHWPNRCVDDYEVENGALKSALAFVAKLIPA
jgi:hypothetical protein